MRLAVHDLATDSIEHIDLEVDKPVTFGRSGHGADIELGMHTSISRSAIALCRRAGERLAVHSLQSVGSVEILAAADRPLAALRRTETHVFAPAPGSLVRVVAGATLAQITVVDVSRVDGEERRVKAPAATVSPWSPRTLWYPDPQQEWMAVAVLAVLAHETSSPFRTLRTYTRAWPWLEVSAGRLTGRLDKALEHFGLEARGDKIPLIARRVIDSGLVGDSELDDVRAELARRQQRLSGLPQV